MALLMACLPVVHCLGRKSATRRGHPSLPFLMVKKKLNKNHHLPMPTAMQPRKVVATPKPKKPLLLHRGKSVEMPSKKQQQKSEDADTITNPKKLITEHHQTPKTIHLPLSTRKKLFGQLTAWTERSDVVGDYDHLAVQHPNITVDETVDFDIECVDAPDEYYEQEEEENDEKTGILEKVVDRTVKKYSKYDFSTGKLFNSKSNKRVCNRTEHELLRKEHHRKKITLSSELIKSVDSNLEDENLSPYVTISRIRQALKDKLRQSMISNEGRNEIVNQTKISELVQKTFKKRLRRRFWQQLIHKHNVPEHVNV